MLVRERCRQLISRQLKDLEGLPAERKELELRRGFPRKSGLTPAVWRSEVRKALGLPALPGDGEEKPHKCLWCQREAEFVCDQLVEPPPGARRAAVCSRQCCRQHASDDGKGGQRCPRCAPIAPVITTPKGVSCHWCNGRGCAACAAARHLRNGRS
jgi:hypothetical protein